MSIALVILAASLVAPSLAPPGPGLTEPPPLVGGRPYVEGTLGDAVSASPFASRTPAERMLSALVFRGLVRLGPGDTIAADLAERWEVDPSGASWTFHLRDGARWQDGEPVTATDVAFTINVLGDPEYSGPGADSWRGVEATVLDALTVRLTLTTPLGGFLVAATQPIAPAHLLAAVPPAELPDHPFGRHPVGSGPFQLVVLDDEHAVLEAWIHDPAPAGDLPLPYLPGIELRFYDSAESLSAAWRSGSLDAVSGLSPSGVAGLAGSTADSTLVRYPGSTLLSIAPNLRSTRPALRDPAVRRALLAAIDRDSIVAVELAGLARRADAPIPPTSWAFDSQKSPEIAFDPDGAVAGLVAAGWTQGDAGWTPRGASEPITIALIGPDRAANPAAFATAQAVVTAWRAIGLLVTHETPAAADLGERLRSGDFDVALLGFNVGLDPDLYPLLASSQTTSSRTNLLGLQDPALDALLSAARAPGTDDARMAAYAALQEQLATGVYLLPIAFRDEVVLVSGDLSGYSTRPIADPGGRFWDVLTWRLAERR